MLNPSRSDVGERQIARRDNGGPAIGFAVFGICDRFLKGAHLWTIGLAVKLLPAPCVPTLRAIVRQRGKHPVDNNRDEERDERLFDNDDSPFNDGESDQRSNHEPKAVEPSRDDPKSDHWVPPGNPTAKSLWNARKNRFIKRMRLRAIRFALRKLIKGTSLRSF